MDLVGKGRRVRIYVNEGDKVGWKPAHLALLEFLRRENAQGATVLRGVEGFGAAGRIHVSHLVDVAQDLPIVVEWIDRPEVVERLIGRVKEMVPRGLITVDETEIVLYQPQPLRDLPGALTAADVMSRQVASVSKDTPLREVVELMLGKVAPWAVLAVLDVVLISLFGVLVFQIPFRGSVMLFALASLLFVLGNLGLGLWISSWASTVNVANQVSALLSMLPGFMLSGFIFSIRNMPPALQAFTYLFPARYFMTINRTLFLKGSGLGVLWPEFAALFAYAAITLMLSASTFKKRV